MDKKTITENLITALMFYGIVNDWSVEDLKDEYACLGIPENMVNEVLNRGIE